MGISYRLFGTILMRVCLVFAVSFLSVTTQAEQFRDYYAEPGLHPFKGSINQHFNEHIDPFGGTLQLSNLDLKIPGNGGMDTNVRKSRLRNWVSLILENTEN